jgi:mannose-6-phosphate isomerase-like protein (cupin superfamily)
MNIRATCLAACGVALVAAMYTGAMAQSGPPPGAGAGPPAGARPPAPPPPLRFWMPKKTPFGQYVAPNKPWWKLNDVLALHKGKASWSQPIIRNKNLAADWHQIAPGQKTQEVAYADSRSAIIIWGGQVKVTMAGQEPFVATKGFQIDIPFRVAFSLEALGNQPALYFEIHVADDMPLYPVTSTTKRPAPVGGYVYEERLGTGGVGAVGPSGKPYLDYYKDVIEGGARPREFIASPGLFVNNIRGRATETPPPSNLGHFHVGYDEFWFVMEGNVDLQVEGEPLIKASAGDVISAAQGRWHRASFGGPIGQMGTRVAVNPFPSGLHVYSVESGGRQ